MKIRLYDDKYLIESDPYCYIVSELKTNGKGEEVKANSKYFMDMAQCLSYIIDKEGKSSEATTLEEYINNIETIANKMNRVLEMLDGITTKDMLLGNLLKLHAKDSDQIKPKKKAKK